MTSNDGKRVFSPRDPVLYPLEVAAVHVGLGYVVAKGTPVMSLRAADGRLLSVRAPLSGHLVGVEVQAGERIDSARCLVRILPSGTAEDPAGVARNPDAASGRASASATPPQRPEDRKRVRAVARFVVSAFAAVGVGFSVSLVLNHTGVIRHLPVFTRSDAPASHPAQPAAAPVSTAAMQLDDEAKERCMIRRGLAETALWITDGEGDLGYGGVCAELFPVRPDQAPATKTEAGYQDDVLMVVESFCDAESGQLVEVLLLSDGSTDFAYSEDEICAR